MKNTNFRKPRTGERLLRVKFRNGWVSRWEYPASALRWTDTGSDWDVIAAEYADAPQVSNSTWTPVSGGY